MLRHRQSIDHLPLLVSQLVSFIPQQGLPCFQANLRGLSILVRASLVDSQTLHVAGHLVNPFDVEVALDKLPLVLRIRFRELIVILLVHKKLSVRHYGKPALCRLLVILSIKLAQSVVPSVRENLRSLILLHDRVKLELVHYIATNDANFLTRELARDKDGVF